MDSIAKKQKDNEKDRGLLFSGVLFLTFASIIGKIFGFIYKVPLNDILGDEMANVNSAYAIYTTLYMISTAGIPVAVSVLISESRARGDRKKLDSIYRISMLALFVLGLVCTLAMIFASGPISNKNSGGDTFLCMLAISPALLFVAVSSVLRGYFQGFGLMKPTAVSQLIESFGKMAIGLVIAYLCVNRYGVSTGVAAALSMLGVTIGIAFGTLYLFLVKKRYHKKGLLTCEGDLPSYNAQNGNENGGADSVRSILKSLLTIAFPIAASSAVMSLSSLVDSQMMRPLLERFYQNADLAKAVYSDYSTGAVTMFNMPMVLISPISCAIVPFIASSLAQNRAEDAKRIMESSLRITALISLPCAFGMSVLASPILSFVFRGDADMADNAGQLLSVLAISIFLVGMLSVTNALLQSHHLQRLPVISMSLGLLVKTVSSYILITRIGAIGAPISTLLFYLTVVVFNFFFVIKHVNLVPNLSSSFIKPLVASLCCSVTAFFVYKVSFEALGLTLSVLISLFCAVTVYASLVFLLRCITKEELSLLPHSERVVGLLEKIHVLR
jgi:stage V sporulation protein B